MIRRLLYLLLLVCATLDLSAQELVVNGVVSDASTGEPLIGATVRVNNTTLATTTDVDGNYSIKANKGQIIKVSYVGYDDMTKTVNGETLNFEMSENAQSLDEVVVVGYGVQKKSDLTGAVTSMKSEDMTNRAITNVNEAFAGKASGVQSYSSTGKPGATPSVQIRGIGSNGSSAPLFVIDGRVATGAGNINPNDIESIEILKDGASAAIYGASAGNGVILITTKKGKGNGIVSYDMQLASQSLAKKPQVMNSEQFIDYFLDKGSINLETIYRNWDFKTNTDWADQIFGHSFFMKHSLSFQGGNERGNFYLSAQYVDNNGMIKGDEDKARYITGMINASYKIKPWLEVGTNNTIESSKVAYVNDASAEDNILGSVIQCSPLMAPTYTLDNMPEAMRPYLTRYISDKICGPLLQDKNGNYYGISPYLSTNRVNPLIIRDATHNELRTFSINGTAYINIDPFKDFRLTSRISYSLGNTETYSYAIPYTGEYAAQKMRGSVSISALNGNTTYWQWENFANYSNKFGLNNLAYMLGMSYSENRTSNVNGSISGNNDGDLGILRNDPLFMYLAYATPGATKSISGGEPAYIRKIAYFGRINYDFDKRYLAQFSLRADAADSSVLPINKRWGYFPSASVGWVLSNEKFMASTASWLSHLKLRASWGQNGSLASLGNWMYDVVISRVGPYNFGNNINYSDGYAPSSTGNPNLKWETSDQTNIGIDARFFNSRLTLGADWYMKKTKDLIVSNAKLSNITGFSASPINAGNIQNSGVEIELGWQDRVGDFWYSVRGNMTTLKNKVTKVFETVDAIDGATVNFSQVLTRFETGLPAWYFYGYKYLGVDPVNGDPIYEDISGNGQIGEEDKTMIGKGIPDFTYGITLTAGWKGIDLMVFGSGVSGVDIYNMYDPFSQYVQNKLTHFTENRWTPTNTSGTMPRAGIDEKTFVTSSAHVFDGSYFKIKQIQLGYTLPKKLLDKIHFQNMRVYASLENFFTFTKYPGFDPEVTGVGNAMGVDFGSYPSSKKVVFGLNIQF